MSLFADKILSVFIAPVGFVIVVGSIALLVSFTVYRRVSQLLFAFSMASLWIFSTPAISSLIVRSLEGQYSPVAVASSPVAQVAVVLGGSTRLSDVDHIDLTDAGDRILHTIDLYRQGKVKTILVAGGNVPWQMNRPIESILIADFLRRQGVADDAILTDTKSGNTRANAIEVSRILGRLGNPQALLVTSAAHMPRAAAAFRKLGIDIIPSPTDFRASAGDRMDLLSLLPNASALSASSEAIREWLGYAVYWWRDWV